MPKRKRKERDKRSQDRKNELPSHKPSRTTQNVFGRQSTIQLPMTNRCNPQLLECISDYSLHAFHCWWRMSTITNLFFSWRIYSYFVPPLDGMHEWNDKKKRVWKSTKSCSQTLFRSITKLGTYNKPANQQSNWPTLNSFWKEFDQYHAPSPPERKPFDMQVPDNVADKYRNNTLTMLSRDFFNRQERCCAHLAKQERWEAVQASKTPRRLRMVMGMKKRRAVDSYFQAI